MPIYDDNCMNDEELHKTSSKYDLIVMFHILEHQRYSIKFLKNIKQLFKHGESLIIEVPNLNDYLIKTSLHYNKLYRQRAHLI